MRTHLRMNGSWHRYRPGERWRRPPSRARLVLEVPGAVAVCFDAPVVELFETRGRGLHPSLGRSGRTCSTRRSTPPRRVAGCATRRGPAIEIAVALVDQRALAGHRQRLQERGPLDRAGLAVHARSRDVDDETLERLVATARRLLVANASPTRGPERVTTGGDRGAPGPLYVYGRAGRPCRRCRTPIRSTRQGTRPAADDVLVPDLPGRTRPMTDVEVVCTRADGQWTCDVTRVGPGWRR